MASNNLEMEITLRTGVEGLDDLNRLNDVLERAGVDVAELRNRTEQLSAAWHSLSTEEQNRQLQELGQAAQNLARDTNRATEQMERLLGTRTNGTIEREIEQVNSSLATLRTRLEQGTISQEEFNRLSAAGAARLDALQAELSGTASDLNRVDNAARQSGSAMDGLGKAINGIAGFFAALGISVGVAELIELADKFKTLQAQVKLATGEGANFVTGFEGVKRVADATFSSIESTADLFGKLTRAGKDIALSQQDALQITQTVNQAIKLSGGSAEAAEAAITQLAQGLSSGVLRGDEFNSVMEQSPRLARAMADGLGVGIGQLRAMAGEGQLTSETIINALKKQSATIDKEFASLPQTVDNSLVLLKNKFMTFIGEIDGQIQSSSKLSDIIQGIAKSIDDIDPTTIATVKEAFTQLGNIAEQLFSTVKGLYTDISDVFNAFSGATDASEKVGLITRALQGVSIIMGTITDGLKAIQVVVEGVFGGWTVGIGMIMRAYEQLTGKSTEAGDAMIKKGDEMVARAKQNALDFHSSSADAINNAAKTNQQRLDETAAKSKAAYDEMAKSGTASADKQKEAFIQYAKDAIAANNGVIDARLKHQLAEKGLQAEIDKTGNVTIKTAEGAVTAAQKHEAATTQAKNAAQALGIDLDVAFNRVSAGFNTTGSQVDKLASGIQGLGLKGQDAADVIYEGWQKWVSQAKSTAEVDLARAKLIQLGIDGKLSTEQVAEGMVLLSNKTKEVDPNFVKLQESAKTLGVNLTGSLNQVSSKFSQSALALDDMQAGLAKTGATGTQAANALYTGWSNFLKTASSQTEVDLAKAKLVEMGNAGVISTDQVKQGMIELEGKTQKVKEAVDPTTEAFKRLGIQSKEAMETAAKQALNDLAEVRKSGDYTQEALQQASQKTLQLAEASGNAALIASAKAQAAANGLAVVTDETGKSTVKSYAEIDRAANNHAETVVQNVGAAYRQVGQIAREEAKSVEDAWNAALAKTLEAETADREKRRTSGMQSQSINLDYIKSQLQGRGVSSDKVEQYAQQIMRDALAQDKVLATRATGSARDIWNQFIQKGEVSVNQADFIAKAASKIALQNLAVPSTVRNIEQGINTVAPNRLPDVVNQPAKTVNYNLKLNDTSVNLQGSPDQQINLDAFMTELERYKKGM